MKGFGKAPAVAAAVALAGGAHPQTVDANSAAPYGPPVADQHVWAHGRLDQFEDRLAGGDSGLRWDGEAWAGPDEWRVRLKSEGELTGGKVSDGQTEAYVSKPVSTYFDIQLGARYDLDSRPGRGWAALGVEGLAPGFFRVAATAYAGDHGLAGKATVSYDQLLTNRLILQPEAEINLYSQDDPARLIGSGLADLDAGLRLRYEITRKFAPYIGVTWEQKFGRTADLTRAAGDRTGEVRFTVGTRAWF
jgi:copper resistance protein B